jgi:hypothetical protein
LPGCAAGTDYLALPIAGVHAVDHMVTFVTDRPGGFTANEIDDLARVGQRLAVVVDRHSQWWITRNVLNAYLGARTGPEVLAGQIRRATGVELTAVLWSSDLRGFTERSDRVSGDRMIEMLNALFGPSTRKETFGKPCYAWPARCAGQTPKAWTLPHNHHHRAIIGMYGGGEDKYLLASSAQRCEGRVEAAGRCLASSR